MTIDLNVWGIVNLSGIHLFVLVNSSENRKVKSFPDNPLSFTKMHKKPPAYLIFDRSRVTCYTSRVLEYSFRIIKSNDMFCTRIEIIFLFFILKGRSEE